MTTLPFKGKAKKGEATAIDAAPSSQSTEKFFIPAHDIRGHSVRVGFRIPPDVKHLISVLMQNAAQFGWETDSDFWRWAGCFAWKYATDRLGDGKISNYGKQVRMMMDIVAERQRLLAFETGFAEIERTYRGLIDDGEREDAEAFISEQRDKIAVMDDDKWRGKWERKFDKRFGARQDKK